MAKRAGAFKLYRLFTTLPDDGQSGYVSRWVGREAGMVGLSIAIFIAIFGWGSTYFGWHDPEGKVQLALATAFILGNVCGYKSKG